MTFDNLKTYSQARAFMTALRGRGFECGETLGGVTVFDHSITPNNYPVLCAVAKEHNASECLDGKTYSHTMMEVMRQEKTS